MKPRVAKVSHARFTTTCDCRTVIPRMTRAWAVHRGNKTAYCCSWQCAINLVNNISKTTKEARQSWQSA